MEHLLLQRAQATAPVLAVPSGQAVGQDVTTTPHATRGRNAAPAAAALAACLNLGQPHSSLSAESHRAAEKPGVCPVVLRGSLGPCLELCDADSDCPGDDKCCTTGCGHTCKPPKGPGLCPPAAEGDGAAKCLLLCQQDKDCPLGQKCCLQGCSWVCVHPLWGTSLPTCCLLGPAWRGQRGAQGGRTTGPPRPSEKEH
uniref:WAP domain-containing protein n=1 Tax=Ficedula albicollis TaxID=59894 RepID=A0A803WDS5_FICAL